MHLVQSLLLTMVKVLLFSWFYLMWSDSENTHQARAINLVCDCLPLEQCIRIWTSLNPRVYGTLLWYPHVKKKKKIENKKFELCLDATFSQVSEWAWLQMEVRFTSICIEQRRLRAATVVCWRSSVISTTRRCEEESESVQIIPVHVAFLSCHWAHHGDRAIAENRMCPLQLVGKDPASSFGSTFLFELEIIKLYSG